MKPKLIIGVIILTLLAPGLLMAQGELSLEGLASHVQNLTEQIEGLTSRVAALFTAQDDFALRLAAVETAIAPTPTDIATPTATATPAPTVTPPA